MPSILRVTALSLALSALCLAAPRHALADEERKEDPAALEEARREYKHGVELAQDAQWGEALAAFERSRKLRPHALTIYNVGASERALARYTRARVSLKEALERNTKSGGQELPASYVDEAKAYLAELERLLAHVIVTLEPATASVTVDGRPLSRAAGDAGPVPVLVAGLVEAGPGQPPPAAKFEIVVDPGPHILTFSQQGFSDSLVRKTFTPGEHGTTELNLAQLPGRLQVTSTVPGSIVTLNSTDLGPVPVEVLRPADLYRVTVKHDQFVAYDAQVRVRPGEEVTLRATMVPEKTPITKRWWFWTAAGAVVAGIAVTTYFIARPAPTRPAVDQGTLGWAAEARQ
jgi:hypothetical protein